MSYTENFFASKASRWAERGQSDDFRREELIRVIEHSVENLTLLELEALYYDMSTKNYINGRSSESRQAYLDGRVVTDEGEVNE